MNHEKNGARRRRDWNYTYSVPALLSRFLVDAVRIDKNSGDPRIRAPPVEK
jgi:hypothetical protein